MHAALSAQITSTDVHTRPLQDQTVLKILAIHPDNIAKVTLDPDAQKLTLNARQADTSEPQPPLHFTYHWQPTKETLDLLQRKDTVVIEQDDGKKTGGYLLLHGTSNPYVLVTFHHYVACSLFS